MSIVQSAFNQSQSKKALRFIRNIQRLFISSNINFLEAPNSNTTWVINYVLAERKRAEKRARETSGARGEMERRKTVVFSFGAAEAFAFQDPINFFTQLFISGTACPRFRFNSSKLMYGRTFWCGRFNWGLNGRNFIELSVIGLSFIWLHDLINIKGYK